MNILGIDSNLVNAMVIGYSRARRRNRAAPRSGKARGRHARPCAAISGRAGSGGKIE
ncbi:hypothetical protein GIY62_32975 [Burkholderia plantarii]|uniref:hypothetical protein n=1 Tax=Burkholderia plantarii TaxID=41899 RepID=UPI00272C5F44|nr:hypothetical protein [Burkholderia plantarii]WLE62209.1 hypothetical protein GIY62_32975 [Burkholderia plantarii]